MRVPITLKVTGPDTRELVTLIAEYAEARGASVELGDVSVTTEEPTHD